MESKPSRRILAFLRLVKQRRGADGLASATVDLYEFGPTIAACERRGLLTMGRGGYRLTAAGEEAADTPLPEDNSATVYREFDGWLLSRRDVILHRGRTQGDILAWARRNGIAVVDLALRRKT